MAVVSTIQVGDFVKPIDHLAVLEEKSSDADYWKFVNWWE